MPTRRFQRASADACTVIEAGYDGPLLDLPELWRHRDLLAILAWRDIRVRYRQTLLGASWALIEPLAGVILFTLIFNRLAGISSGDIPYPLYCYTGMLIWSSFSRALRSATVSLVANSTLVTKAYFPRLVLPLSSQLATLVDLGCGLLLYVLLAVYYRMPFGWSGLTVPLWVLLAWLAALGPGLVLAAVNARFRDASQGLPLLTQVGMFATPLAYPLAAIPQPWLPLYALNPMVGVVEGMRWALLPAYDFQPTLLLPAIAVSSALLLLGLGCFRRAQRRFADII